jgi:hypothetical protein
LLASLVSKVRGQAIEQQVSITFNIRAGAHGIHFGFSSCLQSFLNLNLCSSLALFLQFPCPSKDLLLTNKAEVFAYVLGSVLFFPQIFGVASLMSI